VYLFYDALVSHSSRAFRGPEPVALRHLGITHTAALSCATRHSCRSSRLTHSPGTRRSTHARTLVGIASIVFHLAHSPVTCAGVYRMLRRSCCACCTRTHFRRVARCLTHDVAGTRIACRVALFWCRPPRRRIALGVRTRACCAPPKAHLLSVLRHGGAACVSRISRHRRSSGLASMV